MKVKQAIDKIVKNGRGEGYCIGPNNVFQGKISLQTLLTTKKDSKLLDCLDNNPLSINHDASILQAMEVASDFVGETIPVIDHSERRLVGVVSEADIFAAYLATQSKVRDLEHG
jgi:CIC family chloride channel protein